MKSAVARLNWEHVTFAALWFFIFTLPWSEGTQVIGGVGIVRWAGLMAAGLGIARVAVEGTTRKLSPVHMWMLAFVSWAAISVLWTIDRNVTLTRVGTYVQLLIATWLIWDLCIREARILKLLEAWVFGTAVASISILNNYAQGRAAKDFWGYEAGGSQWDANRYTVAGLNANDLGLTLALGIPIATYLLLKKKGWQWAAVLWAITGLTVAALLLTGSRGSLLAGMAGSMFLPPLVSKMARPNRTIAAVAVVAAVIGGLTLLPGSIVERYESILGEFSGGTLTHRTVIWGAGLEVFRDHALLGVGSGAYGPAVLRAIDMPYVAHNTYLSVAVELGVIGVMLFGALLFSLVYSAGRLPRPDRYFWFATLMTWGVGVCALTWEYRKPTWFLFALLIAQASVQRQVTVKRVVRSVPAFQRPRIGGLRTPRYARSVRTV